MGADVVKVERPEGDEARGWGPPFKLGGGPTFHAVNMNKRSIVLDLKDPEAIAWLKGYIAGADVVVQNLRPGVIEELRKSGVHFRNDLVVGVGGNQILLDDPSGNPVELFEPHPQ